MVTPNQIPARILVIDDEAIVGKRLKQVLEKMGFEIVVETSPIPALEKITQTTFDVVVTDLKMKDMDGMQVLNRVKEVSPGTKVIIITGYAESATAKQAFQSGVYEFIRKPFRLDEIKQVIVRAIEEGKQAP